MCRLVIFLSIAVCVSVVYSAVARLRPVEKPAEYAEQEGCYVPQLKKVLPHNTPFSPQDGSACTQYTCKNDNITIIFTCGSIAVGDGCVIVPGDKHLAYPDCCDKASCNHINR